MPEQKYDVLCVGILVADMFVPPIPRLPQSSELLLVEDILLSAGGCAANTGMDLAKLDARVAVVGKVGNDIFADFVTKEMQEKGLDVSGIRVSTTFPTSRTVILPVIGDDRRFIHAVGANADLHVEDVNHRQVTQAHVLYVGGYLIIPGIEPVSLAHLFRFARERGIKTVLDVAGPRPEEGLKPLTQVLPYTDVFLPNLDEAKIITGESDPFRQADIFIKLGVGTVIITMGGDGAVVRTRVQNLRVPAFKINFVDGSGAGDAFDAGYIIGMLRGWDLHRTITFASAIGASACTQLGTTAGVFTMEQAQVFLERNHLEIQEYEVEG